MNICLCYLTHETCDVEPTYSLYFQSSQKRRARDRAKVEFLSVSILSLPSKGLSGDRGARAGEAVKERSKLLINLPRRGRLKNDPRPRSGCPRAGMRGWRVRGDEKEEKTCGECRSGCEDRSWPRPERGGAGVDYFQRFLLLCKVRESVECLGETSPA